MNPLSKTRRIVVLSALLALFLSTGCALIAGGAVGGAAAAYLKGALRTKEPAPFDKVWVAVVETAEQQEYQITKKESVGGKALIEAKVPERDINVYITVKYHKPEITNLTIKVGVWGNEDESRSILKLIHEKLY